MLLQAGRNQAQLTGVIINVMSKIAQKIQKSQRSREFVYYFVLLLSCESKLSSTLIAAQVYQFKHKIILEPNCKLLLV